MHNDKNKNWLEILLQKSIKANSCFQISCTTCGAHDFWSDLMKAAKVNSDGAAAQKIQFAIIDALKKIEHKNDYRWLEALRFIIFHVDRSFQNRTVIAHELNETWAGSILVSMIEHYENWLELKQKQNEDSKPETIALRRKLKNEVCQSAHAQRILQQTEKARLWKANKKAQGAFWGLAVGDALGAPVEFSARGSFDPVTDMKDGGYFDLPAGAWTDDTSMALCLAQSLIAFPELDPDDLMARFWSWIDKGENSSTGACFDVGLNTMRVMQHFIATGEVFAPAASEQSDGNGAIMRLSPVICFHWRQPHEARRIAALQSRATHYSDKSAAACELMVDILCRLIGGEPWENASQIQPDPAWPEEIKALAQGSWRQKTEPEIRSTGYVVDTLEAALWSVEQSSTFSEAVLKAVNLGDDADTVGAVAGQLAGARYGIDSIPAHWLIQLARRDHLESIAAQLFATAAVWVTDNKRTAS